MNRKAALLVLLVFVLGIAVGALGMYVAESRGIAASSSGKPSQQSYGHAQVQRLSTDLNLTIEQQQQLTAILEDSKGKYQALYESIRPQRDEIRQQGRQRIRGILSAEQLPKFEAYLQHLDAERKKRNRDK